MGGEAFVEISEIGGGNGARGKIGANHFLERELGLRDRRFDQGIVEVVIIVERGRRRGVLDLPQVDPVIEKRLTEAARFRVAEQTFGLGAEHGRLAELAAGGPTAQGIVRRRIPQEEREAGGHRRVVEPAGLLVEENEAGRREHGGVGSHHRLAETQTGGHTLIEQREETLCIGLGHGTPIGAGQERAQQALGIGPGRSGHDIDPGFFNRNDPLARLPAAVAPFAERDHGNRNSRRVGLHRHKGQIAKEQPITGSGGLIVERPLDLHPTESDAGHTVGRHEWISKIIRPRPIETRRVGDEGLVGQQPDFADVVGRGLGGEIKLADPAVEQTVARIDGDGLDRATGRNPVVVGRIGIGRPGLADFIVAVGETLGHAAGRSPHGVAVETNPVAAGDGGAETIPTIREAGNVVARHPADRFEFTGGGIGGADRKRSLEHPDGALRLSTEQRIGHAIGRRVEGVRGKLAGEGALVARVMPHGRRGRALELHGERLTDRVIGGSQVAREVDVGDVERIADFIVAVGLAVVGELAADLEPRRAEQITQGVFVFVAVEPALRGATLAGDEGAIVRDEDLAQRREEGRGLGRIGAGLFLRRHLAGTQAVVDLDPSRKVGLRREIERERGEVEAGGLVLVVVTG